MLNLRKLKQDFSSNILDQGKDLYSEEKVLSAKIIHLDPKTVRISAQVLGQYDNTYESEIEIDRLECETIDSNCDCPYHYDCQHLAALLYYLEVNLDKMLVKYSKETDLDDLEETHEFDEKAKEELLEVVKVAESKEEQRRDESYQKEVLQEYINSSLVLSKSPFFLPTEDVELQKAEVSILLAFSKDQTGICFQLALRLPMRSKPLHIPNLHVFFEALRYQEPIYLGGRRYSFALDSFESMHREIIEILVHYARLPEKSANERALKNGYLEKKIFGELLAKAYAAAARETPRADEPSPFLSLYFESYENPISFSHKPPSLCIQLEYIQPPAKKILLNPLIIVEDQKVTLEHVVLFECASPGLLYDNIYYRFPNEITRQHLRNLYSIRDMTIPEPLFGTFVENSLPQLQRFVKIDNHEIIEEFTTLPFVGNLEAICDLSFLNGELEANLYFIYDELKVPSSSKTLDFEHLTSFISDEGVVSRNLVEECQISEALFQGFIFDPEQEHYFAKTEKKIIEFMTDIIPRYQDRVTFNCPQNLLDQFIYDQTEFKLSLSHTDRMDVYEIDIHVDGALKGVTIDRLWDCIVSKRAFLELEMKRGIGKKEKGNKLPKILVLDLERVGGFVQLFDELGIEELKNHKLERPLWSIANIVASQFKGLPVKFSMTKRLKEIREQMIGQKGLEFSEIPTEVDVTLRSYQTEGVHWLERLRKMYLNGILADDMGLGKTVQAIVAITQHKMGNSSPSLIVCPTSLLYNWKEECSKFNVGLKVLIIDGMPLQRKKLIDQIDNYDVIITSYSLLQKDIELYEKTTFSYAILDEAQHIKNRGTRNAKSVKMIKAEHRLILSGTPIENSLDELWSLFDFLMPGFLNSYDRFIEKYIRVTGDKQTENLKYLRKKVSPFIMRRMKSDVLKDLPPVSELTYHCQLTQTQKELYKSYAESARDELVKLVERDGFDKVQIHVLATLTRLKQICCHPAIFAKETPEEGDSAKYDMLVDLLQTLIEGGHKTVIFSQYTRMLSIMREDFQKRGLKFLYLDGSSKNRLEIVKEFNRDDTIPIFLVSLKAGGTGLNLVGADTVIHYDMWWNPAVENQATDRVHRLGQSQSVSVYKLVTVGTIEEKIVEMQNRKKGIVKKIVSCDDEAITKLTWEDVLELLQT